MYNNQNDLSRAQITSWVHLPDTTTQTLKNGEKPDAPSIGDKYAQVVYVVNSSEVGGGVSTSRSLTGFPALTDSVTDSASVIVSGANMVGVNSLRIINLGADSIDIFSGDLDDIHCVYGDGWGPVTLNGEIYFSSSTNDIPLNGLKAVCDTGDTASVKIIRG